MGVPWSAPGTFFWNWHLVTHHGYQGPYFCEHFLSTTDYFSALLSTAILFEKRLEVDCTNTLLVTKLIRCMSYPCVVIVLPPSKFRSSTQRLPRMKMRVAGRVAEAGALSMIRLNLLACTGSALKRQNFVSRNEISHKYILYGSPRTIGLCSTLNFQGSQIVVSTSPQRKIIQMEILNSVQDLREKPEQKLATCTVRRVPYV